MLLICIFRSVFAKANSIATRLRSTMCKPSPPMRRNSSKTRKPKRSSFLHRHCEFLNTFFYYPQEKITRFYLFSSLYKSDEFVQISVRHIQLAVDYAFALHAQQPDLLYGAAAGLVAAILLIVILVKCCRSKKQDKKQSKKAK